MRRILQLVHRLSRGALVAATSARCGGQPCAALQQPPCILKQTHYRSLLSAPLSLPRAMQSDDEPVCALPNLRKACEPQCAAPWKEYLVSSCHP